jgi:hypothetical protein
MIAEMTPASSSTHLDPRRFARLMMYFMPCFTSEKIVSMLAEIKKI